MTYKQYFFLKITETCISDLFSSAGDSAGWEIQHPDTEDQKLEIKKQQVDIDVWLYCSFDIVKKSAEFFGINLDDEISDISAAEMMFKYIMETKNK